MQRVGGSHSTGQQEPGENRVAPRCPSVALTERDQVTTLPVRLLKNDLGLVPGNSCVDASFQMKMDAQGFAPEDLMVRVDGQNLTVTGQRQQESNDRAKGGYRIEQTVHRQMQLPPNLDLAAMTCSLTPSGHLWVLGQNRPLPPPEAPKGQAPRLKSRGHKGSK
ncbi:heat shock protein beta-9 [Mesocricetus auratus]|uniref:Heat shock protein beta-9 n=1 Tax=Mesocricetus auratus TaxID=10036 RepID=A0ABM2XSQ8_MESAU|nr:heat shock protein beta-9 [Mesocricetus auratus]